jgi:hypothetical protein
MIKLIDFIKNIIHKYLSVNKDIFSWLISKIKIDNYYFLINRKHVLIKNCQIAFN